MLFNTQTHTWDIVFFIIPSSTLQRGWGKEARAVGMKTRVFVSSHVKRILSQVEWRKISAKNFFPLSFNLNWLTMFYCGFVLLPFVYWLCCCNNCISVIETLLPSFYLLIFFEGLPRSTEFKCDSCWFRHFFPLLLCGLFCNCKCIFHLTPMFTQKIVSC